MQSLLSELKFVDLYIGDDYCDIKGLEGSETLRSKIPPDLEGEIGRIREICKTTYDEQQESEFSIIHDGVMFRVTLMVDVLNKDIFILRRPSAEIRAHNKIGLSPLVTSFALAKDTRGLILVVGEMAAGKSSTIASLFRDRLALHGGIGLAIEDPPETRLNGEHGPGRCIQIRASRKNGGYREQLVRAVRSGADTILLGEIRDEDTAYQVAQAGINGHLILSTMHASGIVQGLERLSTWCKTKTTNANDVLSEGLAAIVYQELERVRRQGGVGYSIRFASKALVLTGSIGQSARAKIRAGQFHLLSQEIDEQARRAVWQDSNKKDS